MTPEQAQALTFLSGRTWGATAEEFAYAMWPNSPSWHAKVRPGVGVCFSARALLNRMTDERWVTKAQTSPVIVYTTTKVGVNALSAYINRGQRQEAQRVHQVKRPCRSTAGRARRAWKDVTCPACLRHRPRGASSTPRRPSNASRTPTRKRTKRSSS